MPTRRLVPALVLLLVSMLGLCTSGLAQVLVWSMGNAQDKTQAIANWISASGRFSSVTAIDSTTVTATELSNYQQVLFFSNGSGDPLAGDVLATFAETGRRLVVATFSWADQGSNTLGGRFITSEISPVVSNGSPTYTSATIGSTDGSALFTGVNSITASFRDKVVATTGATVQAVWSDGVPMVVTKGNVVAITLFPDDSWGQVSGDSRQLFINALSVPEPSTYALLALGLAVTLGTIRRRR